MPGCFICRRTKAKARIAELVAQFGLTDYLDQAASDLPLGIRQRLSLAVAVVHEPEMLILDEPTSGVDPLARDRFWELLIDLSRNQGVTIFVSTHFMNEAERCDRISLMDAGRVLATDTPATSSRRAAPPPWRTRSSAIWKRPTGRVRCRRPKQCALRSGIAQVAVAAERAARRRAFSLQRLVAYTIRETLELFRDPIRLGFALFGTAFLMLVFGFGISTDVNNLTFAVLDHDQSHESRAYLEELRGSALFRGEAAARRLCRSREAPAERRDRRRDRDPAGFRPRHRARASGLGRRLDRRRHAVPRRDHPRLSAGHASALSDAIRR